MKNYHNIETCKFHGHNFYVGYDSKGDSWRIYKRYALWKAVKNADHGDIETGRTLKEISEKLAAK